MFYENKSVLIILLSISAILFGLSVVSDKVEEKWLDEQIEISKGIKYYNDGEYDVAQDIFRKYLAKDRYENSNILNTYVGKILIAQKDYKSAEEHYKIAYNVNYRLLLDENFMQDIRIIKEAIYENKE